MGPPCLCKVVLIFVRFLGPVRLLGGVVVVLVLVLVLLGPRLQGLGRVVAFDRGNNKVEKIRSAATELGRFTPGPFSPLGVSPHLYVHPCLSQ